MTSDTSSKRLIEGSGDTKYVLSGVLQLDPCLFVVILTLILLVAILANKK